MRLCHEYLKSLHVKVQKKRNKQRKRNVEVISHPLTIAKDMFFFLMQGLKTVSESALTNVQSNINVIALAMLWLISFILLLNHISI